MAIESSPGKLSRALMKVLDMPERTVWFEVRCEVDEIVKVKCCFIANVNDVGELESITKTYRLEEIADDENENTKGGA